ncbi:MAG: hypothetical protein KDB14_06580 [Planctomycetales bacterium]|nr:hypothetical protein [Planctomycetales bacterium]
MPKSRLVKLLGAGVLALASFLVAAAASAQPPALNAPQVGAGSSEPTPPPPPTPVTPTPTPKRSPSAPVPGSGNPTDGLLAPEQLSGQVTKLLRELLPREYESKKKWGLTERVVSGVEFSREGFRLETHRRWRTVKQGLWKRYRATLVNPDEELQLEITRVSEAASGQVEMDIVLLSRLDLEGQIAKYQRNVRVFSLTAVADATVQLKLTLEMGVTLDPTRLPPEVALDLKVTDAQLELLKFRLRRLSDLHGGPAKQLGKLFEDYAREELADQRVKLVDKLNKKIDKNRDRLRLSFRDLLPDTWKDASKQEKATNAPASTKAPAPETTARDNDASATQRQ